MTSYNTRAGISPRPAPRPAHLRGHIGDLPHDVLNRILVWKLLTNGEESAFADFVAAAPFLAFQVGVGTDILAVCGIHETHNSWQDDIEFWVKFNALRRYQKRQRC